MTAKIDATHVGNALDPANVMLCRVTVVRNFEASQTHVHCGFSTLVVSVVVWPLGWDMAPSVGRHAVHNRGLFREKSCVGISVGRRRTELGRLLCWQGQGSSPDRHQGLDIQNPGQQDDARIAGVSGCFCVPISPQFWRSSS